MIQVPPQVWYRVEVSEGPKLLLVRWHQTQGEANARARNLRRPGVDVRVSTAVIHGDHVPQDLDF